jgi:hypothetical protein
VNEHKATFGDPVDRCARAAARRLSPDYGPEIEAQVEAALYSRRATEPSTRYLDLISLGSLIVSTATLAWTLYKDLRTKALKPARETVVKRVRIELPETDVVPPADLDKLIELVVEEIIEDAE